MTLVQWLLFVMLVGFLPISAANTVEGLAFPDQQTRERYNALIDELRCPQCLNTNLAGSDAMIAMNLRREVHRMVLEGTSNDGMCAVILDWSLANQAQAKLFCRANVLTPL